MYLIIRSKNLVNAAVTIYGPIPDDVYKFLKYSEMKQPVIKNRDTYEKMDNELSIYLSLFRTLYILYFKEYVIISSIIYVGPISGASEVIYVVQRNSHPSPRKLTSVPKGLLHHFKLSNDKTQNSSLDDTQLYEVLKYNMDKSYYLGIDKLENLTNKKVNLFDYGRTSFKIKKGFEHEYKNTRFRRPRTLLEMITGSYPDSEDADEPYSVVQRKDRIPPSGRSWTSTNLVDPLEEPRYFSSRTLRMAIKKRYHMHDSSSSNHSRDYLYFKN